MKKLFILIFTMYYLMAFSCVAQQHELTAFEKKEIRRSFWNDSEMFQQPKKEIKSWNYTRTATAFGLGVLGGASRGLHETITYHYSSFKKVHPNANDAFWNPEISWTNKYKNGDVKQGEAYILSTTALAWTTDAKHLTDIINTGSLVGGTLVVTLGEKRKWYEYAIDLGAMFVGRSIGFYGVYNIIYK